MPPHATTLESDLAALLVGVDLGEEDVGGAGHAQRSVVQLRQEAPTCSCLPAPRRPGTHAVSSSSSPGCAAPWRSGPGRPRHLRLPMPGTARLSPSPARISPCCPPVSAESSTAVSVLLLPATYNTPSHSQIAGQWDPGLQVHPVPLSIGWPGPVEDRVVRFAVRPRHAPELAIRAKDKIRFADGVAGLVRHRAWIERSDRSDPRRRPRREGYGSPSSSSGRSELVRSSPPFSAE